MGHLVAGCGVLAPGLSDSAYRLHCPGRPPARHGAVKRLRSRELQLAEERRLHRRGLLSSLPTTSRHSIAYCRPSKVRTRARLGSSATR
jgi:hypothetical protein